MALAWADAERELEDEFEDSTVAHRTCSRHGWDDRQRHRRLSVVWRPDASMIEGLSGVESPWAPVSDLGAYDADLNQEEFYFVSSSGQVLLPATARHRWNLNDGGPVDMVDLGFAVLALPAGEGRRLLSDLRSRDEHAEFVRSLSEDPDLATT